MSSLVALPSSRRQTKRFHVTQFSAFRRMKRSLRLICRFCPDLIFEFSILYLEYRRDIWLLPLLLRIYELVPVTSSVPLRLTLLSGRNCTQPFPTVPGPCLAFGPVCSLPYSETCIAVLKARLLDFIYAKRSNVNLKSGYF